ncbi:MAG: Fic family protein [candidate division KSB1 bacterium]|nr:Fic family protein [candidate division KSB1 bacterium]MDZ7367209.1 Fic family protein [candidate division KSB1 bacterium]MDZ7405308.1 Fic family protein [candidate division KSB1 bacterium]
MAQFYNVEETLSLTQLLEEIDTLQEKINSQKPFQEAIWSTIQEKLRIEWTYDSNALEGSTLTKGETYFFLREGLTVEGKPFKDFLDARNHAEAIDYLYQIIEDERPITPGLMKEFNKLLLSGITHTEALNEMGQRVQQPATPGEYKRLPNHVLQADGTIHRYTEPLHVPAEMNELFKWIQESFVHKHPVVISAVAHYNLVRIHPFDDGNGRGARILMNLILIKKHYVPAIIRKEQRRAYLETLGLADAGNLSPFTELVARSLLNTQQIIIDDLNENST